MSSSTPARLYCTLVGAVLVIAGIIGFFYSASFATGAAEVGVDADNVFGILAVNGWHNLVHIALGLLALAVAGSTSGARAYCLGIGLVYVVLAIWGWIDSDGVLLGPDPGQRRGQRPAPGPRAGRAGGRGGHSDGGADDGPRPPSASWYLQRAAPGHGDALRERGVGEPEGAHRVTLAVLGDLDRARADRARRSSRNPVLVAVVLAVSRPEDLGDDPGFAVHEVVGVAEALPGRLGDEDIQPVQVIGGQREGDEPDCGCRPW